MKFNLTYKELKLAERSVYSQGGQDGVLEAIFNQIGEGNKMFCEFGARDGVELSNTANLRINKGWAGLLMDSNPLAFFVKQAFITEGNINDWFDKYNLKEYTFLSIDVDGNDYWIWKQLNYTPQVVLIEFNSKFNNDESFSIEPNPEHKWEGDDYYGASLLALKKLGEQKGYTLVYVVDRYDAVFIRNDLISPDYVVPTLDELNPIPIIAHENKSEKLWVTV